MTIKAILATDLAGGIARDGVMPWPSNKEDLKHFAKRTKGQVVVMGSSTWEAIDMPSPLPGRTNIVITNNPDNLTPGFCASYGGTMKYIIAAISDDYGLDFWIIGGAKIIEAAMEFIDEFHLSVINDEFHCDTFISKSLIDEHLTLCYTTDINDITTLKVYKRID